MTAKRAILAVVALMLLGGCQNGAGTYQTVRLPVGDYDRTFEVARQVIGERFTVEQADKKSGRIVTSPQAVPSGDLPGGMVDLSGAVQGMRRVVTAQVSPMDGTTRVSVKVQLERAEALQSVPKPTYSEYEPTETGAESSVFARPEEHIGVTWRKAGSDAQMEKQLLNEIERRLKAGGSTTEAQEEPSESKEQ